MAWSLRAMKGMDSWSKLRYFRVWVSALQTRIYVLCSSSPPRTPKNSNSVPLRRRVRYAWHILHVELFLTFNIDSGGKGIPCSDPLLCSTRFVWPEALLNKSRPCMGYKTIQKIHNSYEEVGYKKIYIAPGFWKLELGKEPGSTWAWFEGNLMIEI